MKPEEQRAHGVTPGLRQDYATRTAEQQAAFVLPYLEAGMDLLDAGCGPGTITLGLARAVLPGRVIGLDHDAEHIEEARRLARREGVDNVEFRAGDVLSLPMEAESMGAAFENNLFIHLAEQAEQAAKQIHKVLKPGGFFAARDVDEDAVLWGARSDVIAELDKLMFAWHQNRGSDMKLGKRLPSILQAAGFVRIQTTISADTKSTPEDIRSHADITLALLDGPLGRAIIEHGWADHTAVERLRAGIQAWAEAPGAFFANVHVEVIGWKPG